MSGPSRSITSTRSVWSPPGVARGYSQHNVVSAVSSHRSRRWELTADGADWSTGAGVDVRPPATGRDAIRPCLDWTVRRDHAAGYVADRFLTRALEAGWVRRGRHPRAIRLTAE